MTALAETHTPVAIDLPGHGQSAGRGFRGAADYSYFVVKLALALGWERFVVAGHSMGGAIALTTALYHADLLNGLLLIDTGARLRVHPDILQVSRLAAETGRRLPMRRDWGFASTTEQSVVDAVEAMTVDTDPRVTYVDWICDDTFDCLSRLKDIRVPALAICGQEDRLTPVKYHQFFHTHMPSCQLAVIKQAGHWLFLEQPQEFTRLVRDFLDRLPRR
jgi:pimeloyl-ACP methyl ester carboxylesterase